MHSLQQANLTIKYIDLFVYTKTKGLKIPGMAQPLSVVLELMFIEPKKIKYLQLKHKILPFFMFREGGQHPSSSL